MKTNFTILAAAVLLFNLHAASAQCTLTPTVVPTEVILCPNEDDTLFTESYDTYQWYKGNNAIAGATNQYYVVTENDLGKKFKVTVTLDTCIGTSSSVLVDGYAFLFPYIIQTGDLGYYDPQLGANILCEGDTMVLTMGLPYNTNVQWFDNNDPIAGATSTDFYATQSGSYTACGAPEVCPNFNSCEVIPINIIFGGIAATVSFQNDTLFSTPAASYQWVLDGSSVAGATNQFFVPAVSGAYAVTVTDQYNCSSISDPYEFIATSVQTVNEKEFQLYPNPASEKINIQIQDGHVSSIVVTDLPGRIVYTENFEPRYGSFIIDVSKWPKGWYIVTIDTGSQLLQQPVLKQ
jgi:hypothetical protein